MIDRYLRKAGPQSTGLQKVTVDILRSKLFIALSNGLEYLPINLRKQNNDAFSKRSLVGLGDFSVISVGKPCFLNAISDTV